MNGNGKTASGNISTTGLNNFTTIGCGSSASGKGGAIIVDHTKAMTVAPSSFV